MWTVCWTEQFLGTPTDKWERCERKDMMEEHVRNLIDEGISIEDILVFAPDTEFDVSYIADLAG